MRSVISRRRVLTIVALSGAGALAWHFGLAGQGDDLERVSETRVLMGTIVNLTIVGSDPAAARQAIQATLGEMAKLETELSRFRPDSELSRLNAAGRVEPAGSALKAILEQALEISRLSNGAFDVTVRPVLDVFERAQAEDRLPDPIEIDAARALVNYRRIQWDDRSVQLADPGMSVTLDGIAKGYIVDRAASILRTRGYPNVLVEAGGDLMAAGAKEAGLPWKVGVQPPRKQTEGMVATFTLDGRAAATSGDYMHYFTPDFRNHHILDPRTGHSPQELACATVIAPSAMLADGLATAVMVLGSESGLSLASSLGCEALVVAKGGQVMHTDGFPG